MNSLNFEFRTDQKLKTAGAVNATKIAVEEIGRDIPNTCLLGAFAAATGWVKLGSILKVVQDYLSGEMLQRIIRSCERGFQEVKILRWQ